MSDITVNTPAPIVVQVKQSSKTEVVGTLSPAAIGVEVKQVGKTEVTAPSSTGVGVSRLAELLDVDTSGQSDGAVLYYNTANGDYEFSTIDGNRLTIQIRRSEVPGESPSSLANGELFLNFADQLLYYKHANGAIVVLANGAIVTSTVIDLYARAHSNGAFDHANTAYDTANTALSTSILAIDTADSANISAQTSLIAATSANVTAHAAFDEANLAFTLANTANTQAQSAYSKANGAFSKANGAFNQANGATIAAQAGFDHSNGAFDLANTDAIVAQAAFNKANTANTTGQAAFDKANSATTTAQGAYDHSNGAFTKANTASTTATAAFNKANTANVTAQAAFDHSNGAFDLANTDSIVAHAAFDEANTANTTATAAYDQANTGTIIAQSGYDHSNAAFNKANTSNVTAQAAFNKANGAFIKANAAYDQANTGTIIALAAFGEANTANTTAQAAFDEANTANTTAQAGFNKANTANVTAQAAFDKANADFILANTANTVAASAYNRANGAFSKANGAYNQANGATIIAEASYDQANVATDLAQGAYDHANGAFDEANTANTIAQAGFDKANSGFTLATTANTTAQAAFNKANSANVLAQTARNNSNGAFTQANTANVTAQAAFDLANTDAIVSQAAFDEANAAGGIAQGAFDLANTDAIVAQAAFNKANSANVTAQAAFNKANAAVVSVSGKTGVVVLDTNDVAENLSSNLWFTAARVRANLSNTTPINYDPTTGTFSHADSGAVASGYGDAATVPKIVVDAKGHVTGVTNTAIAISATQITSGTLAIARGGTGQTAITVNGSLLIGNTVSGGYDVNALTPGAGITIQNDKGSITITATGTNATDQFARDQANAAYARANVANGVAAYAAAHANTGFDKANSANVTAQAGFDKANAANVLAQSAYNQANAFSITTQAAFDRANTANTTGQAAFDQANAAYTRGNTAFDKANLAFGLATAANTTGQAAFDHSNGAFNLANTDAIVAQAAFDEANLSFTLANTANTTGQAAFNQANAAYTRANTANTTAQAGFDQANAAYTRANTANTTGQAAFDQANAAYTRANTANTTGQASFDQANAAYTRANNAYANANTAIYTAAQIRANISNTAPINYDPATGIISHALSGVTATGYGDAVTVPKFVVDDKGHVTSVVNTAIQLGSTSQIGLVLLEDSVVSVSTSNAATPNSVNTTYTLANNAETVAQAAYDFANTIQLQAASIGPGGTYFLDSTIQPQGNNFSLFTFASQNIETIVSCTPISNTRFLARFVGNTAPGAGTVEGGIWIFNTWANVAATGGTTEILCRINKRVIQTTGTITSVGSGGTRSFRVYGATPFVAGDANPDITVASLIETPNSTFWISTFANSAAVTAVGQDAAYVNEDNVAFSIYYLIVPAVSTGGIPTTTVALYSNTITAPGFTLGETDKIMAAYFGKSSTTKTPKLFFGGTLHYSNIETPIPVRHNQLIGLQGGGADEFYHLTEAEHNALGVGQAAYDFANGVAITAQAAFNEANTADVLAQGAYNKANAAAQQSFVTLNVAGQDNVVADSNSDTLILVAGASMVITTDAANDTITFSSTASGSSGNSFSTINVAGQDDVVADSNADTLVLVAGTGIDITTDSPNDIITISATGTSAIDGFARDQANAAYDQANVATDLAQGAYDLANTDAIVAQGAYDTANVATIIALAAYSEANTADVLAQGAYNKANGAAQESFVTINIAGQDNVVADSNSDTLILVAGPGVILTTDAGNDTITIEATATPGGNSFSTFNVAGQDDVVADSNADTLILVGGTGIDIITDAPNDTITISATGTSAIDQYARDKANGAAQESFVTFVVAGQDDVVADSNTDTMTLVAGASMVITTDAANDTITFSSTASGGSGNSFTTINVAGQGDIVADSNADTLTLVSGTGITITTDAANDAITIDSHAYGNGTDKVFFENDQNVTSDYSITAGKSAMSAGPVITLDAGVLVTVPAGSRWIII